MPETGLTRRAALAALSAAMVAVPLRGWSQDGAVAGPGSAPDFDVGDRRGGLLDEIVFVTEGDMGKVAGLIADGTYQLHAQGVTNQTVFRRLRETPGVEFDRSFGSSMELTLNPAGPEVGDGELNPFHVPRIREALNWLIDRRHIAQEIFGGLARPRFMAISTVVPDYARLAASAREVELRYQPDRAHALRVIEAEMTELGAERRDGVWHYRGGPVTLRFLIRNDDIRRQVGDHIANLLTDAGFRVERLYRGAEESSRIWIAQDPSAGGWHIYTGSWVSIVVQRDSADSFNFYYTPRGRADPLWQAYTPEPEFDDLAERLSRGDYADLQERTEMMARAMTLSMRDSARVWLVDQTQIGPRAARAGVAVDLAGGVRGSQLWPLTLHDRDGVGGSMTFATPSVLTEPWNPVAGTNWLFDRMVLRAINDAPFFPDPFTGLYRPQRVAAATLRLAPDLPVSATLDWLTLERSDGPIAVPPDTLVTWDAGRQRFLTAEEAGQAGLTARTCSTVRFEDGYFERSWHDGSRVSLADVLVSWALTFARADGDSALFDPSHVPAFEAFERHFRGWRVVSTDPFEVEIYSDQISPDGETIVAMRTPGVMPWHVLALAIMAEEEGELAFSSHKADSIRAEWLSLVTGPSLPVLDTMLERARASEHVPLAGLLGDLVSAEELRERYDNLARWRAERRHFQIGDGAYMLHSVYPLEGALVLRHFPDFPDPADKWLGFADPPIPALTLDGPMMVHRGEAARFELRVSFAGAPYPTEDVAAAQFLLFDGDGDLIHRGDAVAQGEGRWEIDLSAEEIDTLGIGANSLEIVLTARPVAMPAFASHAFATVPAGTPSLTE